MNDVDTYDVHFLRGNLLLYKVFVSAQGFADAAAEGFRALGHQHYTVGSDEQLTVTIQKLRPSDN